MLPATLIAIEGADRLGKLTQSKMLKSHLENLGFKVLLIEAPIKSSVTYRIIYWMLGNGMAVKMPNVFQFVQFLNKLVFQFMKLIFARRFYSYIIFDRWSLSALVYGDASGAKTFLNKVCYNILMKPDATIVLTGDARSSDVEDDYEADRMFQMKVRTGYHIWQRNNDDVSALIDNSGSREDVHQRIMSAIDKKFDLL